MALMHKWQNANERNQKIPRNKTADKHRSARYCKGGNGRPAEINFPYFRQFYHFS